MNPSRFAGASTFDSLYGDTGLVAYWKFQEASGDVINQSASAVDFGTAADVQIVGATYQQTGLGNFPYSMLFDGTNDTGYAGTSLSDWNFMHNTSQKFSINLWYKKNATLHNVISLMGDGSDNTAHIGISIYFTSTGIIGINTTNGSGQDALATGVVIGENSDWHMLTITYDRSLASANILTYIDGVLQSTINKGGSFVPSNSNSTSKMGVSVYQPTANQFFHGYITEWSVFKDRILTSTEVTSLYNSGNGLAIY